MSRFLLVPALLAIGCGHAAIDHRHDAMVAEADARAASGIVYARCSEGTIGPSCGLILQHTATPSFRERFREHVCAAKTDEDCEAAFRRLVDAELDKRYFAADWAAVARRCDLTPPTCDDPIAYERLLIQSHNANIQSRHADEEDRIEAQRRAAHDEQARQTLKVVGEVAYVLHPGPKCRSYPSVVSGVTNTICTQ